MDLPLLGVRSLRHSPLYGLYGICFGPCGHGAGRTAPRPRGPVTLRSITQTHSAATRVP